MSQQTNYGTVEPPAVGTPRRARGVVLALALCAGGALFAVAGPGPSPRLRGGGAKSRGTTGAGKGPEGMGVSD